MDTLPGGKAKSDYLLVGAEGAAGADGVVFSTLLGVKGAVGMGFFSLILSTTE
jgi:hypothetical protein